MADDGTLLQVRGLRSWFEARGRPGTIRAVDGVSLDVREGEVLGLVGESGCGKTSLARAILRLIPIREGNVLWKGEDISRLEGGELRRRRRDWQLVFQDPYSSLNPRLTVLDTLGEAVRQRHPRRRGRDLEKAVLTLLDQVGLASQHLRRYPHEFSGGQRQRIAIARALATEPELIVADEPVSALDVSIQAQILNLLNVLRRERKLTMIFVSHDLAVVHYLADRIAVMQAGQVVEHGPADAIMQTPRHRYTQTLLAAIPRPDPARKGMPRSLARQEPPSPYAPPDTPPRPEPTFDEPAPGHFVATSEG